MENYSVVVFNLLKEYSVIEMNKIKFIVFINIINNYFIFIEKGFTTLYKNNLI
jgi:hypothetical protein